MDSRTSSDNPESLKRLLTDNTQNHASSANYTTKTVPETVIGMKVKLDNINQSLDKMKVIAEKLAG